MTSESGWMVTSGWGWRGVADEAMVETVETESAVEAADWGLGGRFGVWP
jgi:hypothetical protein